MKKLLLFMFAVVAFAACEQAPVEEQSAIRPDAPDTITVGFEGDDETRIQLNEAQKTVWNSGDEVSVFYKSDANQKYEYRGETGERTAELHKVSAGSSTTKMGYVVVAYPYNEEYIISPASGNLETMLPAVQHYAVDSYGVGDNLMVSCSEFTQFSLKSVCGWLKLQLTGNGEVVKGIKFRGNNGEQVAGLIHVDTKSAEATLYSEEVAPDDNGNANGSLVIDGAMATEVMLYCDEGVTLSSEATAFYIALPPQTFEEGFTVDVICTDGTMMAKSSDKKLSIERNHIQPMAAFEFAATGTTDIPGILTVVENSVEVAFYGGKGVINYAITGGAEGDKPVVTANVDWVTNITVAETITFNVDFNNVEESRVATLNVAYGEQSFDVFVRQAEGMAVDVEFVATTLNGEYCGTAYSKDPNYLAILSKNGTTGWNDLLDFDMYYRFDIYAKQPTDVSAPMLPQGVYSYDYLNSGVGDTFGDFYSMRIETFQNGSNKVTKIEDGVVIVTENKIEAILKMADGKVHRVVYEGSLALSYIEIPEPDYYSTLTEDLIFDHPEGIIRLNYFGDYYGIGGANWIVSMVLPGTNINGDYFIIDIVTDSVEFNASNIVGTYNCVEEANVAKNTFIKGTYSGGFASSWYFVAVDNYYGTDDVAPIVDGTITIREEGIKFVVEFDCMDDNGHKIAGTFACSGLEMYDNSK